MTQIIYENESSLLSFDYKDVTDALTSQINEHHVEEDSLLLNWLNKKVINGKRDIKFNDEDRYEDLEYLDCIVFFINDMLSYEKAGVALIVLGLNTPAFW